jgi:hypothetical protein
MNSAVLVSAQFDLALYVRLWQGPTGICEFTRSVDTALPRAGMFLRS